MLEHYASGHPLPRNPNGWFAVGLSHELLAGDVKAVREAVEQGADVKARNEYGVSALWIATGKGKLDVVEYLVEKATP